MLEQALVEERSYNWGGNQQQRATREDGKDARGVARKKDGGDYENDHGQARRGVGGMGGDVTDYNNYSHDAKRSRSSPAPGASLRYR